MAENQELIQQANSLLDNLKKKFSENQYRYLVFPYSEKPEGMLVGLSKDTSDYYYIVLTSDLKLKYISVVGKVNFIDYGTESYPFADFSTINYMFMHDLCYSILRVHKEIRNTLGNDTLICQIN